MALSFLSDYGSSTYQRFSNDTNGSFACLGNEVYGNECGFCFCDSCCNLNTLHDGFYQAEDPYFTQLLPPFPSQEYNSSSELYHQDDYLDLLHNPKRARTECPQYYDGYSVMIHSVNSLPNCVHAPEFFPGFAPQPLEFRVPAPNGSSSCSTSADQEAKKAPEGGSLSTQSAAARQRRKKLSEKTQELRKLVPGCNKMNTAEMFQAAFNYVKFMEAQLELLQFMETEKLDSGNLEGLRALLYSPRIQEKLYGDRKCIVPKEVVGTLATDQRLRSNPSLSKDLDSLIQSLS